MYEELLTELDNEESQMKAFARYQSEIATENTKRERIYELFQRLGKTDDVLLVLEIFMPGVKLHTIMKGRKGEYEEMPKRERFGIKN